MSRDAVAAQAGLPRLAKPRDFHKRLQWDAAITCEKGLLVRSRGLEPPRVAPLAPQASASTNSATTAAGIRGPLRLACDGAHVTNQTRPNKVARQKNGRASPLSRCRPRAGANP